MCRSTRYHRDDVKRTGWTEPSPPPPSARGCGRRRRFVRSVREKFCHHHDESTAALARAVSYHQSTTTSRRLARTPRARSSWIAAGGVSVLAMMTSTVRRPSRSRRRASTGRCESRRATPVVARGGEDVDRRRGCPKRARIYDSAPRAKPLPRVATSNTILPGPDPIRVFPSRRRTPTRSLVRFTRARTRTPPGPPRRLSFPSSSRSSRRSARARPHPVNPTPRARLSPARSASPHTTTPPTRLTRACRSRPRRLSRARFAGASPQPRSMRTRGCCRCTRISTRSVSSRRSSTWPKPRRTFPSPPRWTPSSPRSARIRSRSSPATPGAENPRRCRSI